jgi:hypothetical protein
MTSLQFNGVAPFFIITSVLVSIPVLFNLVVMSHYWNRVLLVVGAVMNGIAGAGAIATVVIAWADPKYSSESHEAPSMEQGNIVLLLVFSMTSMSAVLELILLISSLRPDSTYSCCWGSMGDNRQRSDSPSKAPRYFVHLIRCMRAASVLLLLSNVALFFGWLFAGIRVSPGHKGNLVVTTLSHISLFFFATTLIWSFVTLTISFNLNSARKLRFAAWNGLFVILVSLPLAVWSWFVYRKSPLGVSPSPWIMPIVCAIEIGWNICAYILAYSGYQFRSNGWWWPDCTSQSHFEEEFEPLADNDDL